VVRWTPRAVASALLVVALLAPSPARAGDGDGDAIRCSDSYERAQVLRRAEDFSGARASLEVCRRTCPADLAADCDRWRDELGVLSPSIRLDVRDEHGAPLSGVTVRDDRGRLEADADGAYPLRPGRHRLRLARAGSVPAEVVVELHPGERGHLVSATLSSALAPPRGSADGGRGSLVPSIVLGGAGVAGLVAAGVLALKGHLDRAELRRTCDPADVDAVRTLFWTSAGVAVASGLALGGALLLLPRPRATLSAAGAGLSLRVLLD